MASFSLKRKILILIIIIAVIVYLNNSSLLVKKSDEEPWLLAHRGLAQTFPMEGITGKTNTARRIYEPEHPYLENTIPSMEAAFKAGADMVEFDIHPTRDGKFAVFHDWILDYRTDGEGVTREHTMAELKTLDIGYGYTADNGKTYPFRGKGIGMMPSLDEVLNHFPDGDFLIHPKGNSVREGELLAEYLKKLPEECLQKLTFYGGDRTIATLSKELPNLRVMSKATMKKGLLAYMAVGWTGYIPESMRDSHFHLPLKYARYLWGWPHRFMKRMERADSQFILVLGTGKWSEGFDQTEDLEQLPANYTGGIWTNRIDRIAPVFEKTN